MDYVFLDHIDLPNNSINYENLDQEILKYLNTEIDSLNIVKNIDDSQKIIQSLINIF
ncbi:MAG: hypothetical protein WCG25_06865 [bacterium]